VARTSTGAIVAAAQRAGGAACAFNVIALEHAEGIIRGAESSGAPVILQVSQNAVRYHGSLAPIGTAMLAVAAAAHVPVAVHLDHATDAALVAEAVDLGFDSVMFDASTLCYEQNVSDTRAVVAHCHERGVLVEAELGVVGGKDGDHGRSARTDPAEAAAYAAATHADLLAVAVGSSHAMIVRHARLEHELIAVLRAAVPVPLVLHGSSGVPDDDLARAVKHGIVKVNVATRLNAAFTHAVRDRLHAEPGLLDARRYLGAGRDAIADEVRRVLTLLSSAVEVCTDSRSNRA